MTALLAALGKDLAPVSPDYHLLKAVGEELAGLIPGDIESPGPGRIHCGRGGQRRCQGIGKFFWGPGGYQAAKCRVRDFGDAPDARGHERPAAHHGLPEHIGDSFGEAGQGNHIAGPVPLGKERLGNGAGQVHLVVQMVTPDKSPYG